MFNENICLDCRQELLSGFVNDYRQVKSLGVGEQLTLLKKLAESGLHKDVFYFVETLLFVETKSSHPDINLRLSFNSLAGCFNDLVESKNTLAEDVIVDNILGLPDTVSCLGLHADLRHFVALALREEFTNLVGPKPVSVVEDLKLHMAALKAGRTNGINERIKATVKIDA